MKPTESPRIAVGVAIFCALGLVGAAGALSAQGFRVIHFCNATDEFPSALIQAPIPDGNFYFTSLGGGTGFGSVHKMNSAGSVSTIHAFAGQPSDGRGPRVGLFLNDDGLLYGTTYNGGTNNVGTVFHLDTAGGTYAVHSQTTPMGLCDANGISPDASFMRASDGNLYVPMSLCGATGQYGTVVGVDTSLNETPVAVGFETFYGDVTHPSGHLVEGSDNNLYGTGDESGTLSTYVGGVYRIGPGGGAVETVHAFSGPDGSSPQAPLVRASDGYFYGTTYELTNASHNELQTGTIFKVAEDGTFQTVHAFNGADGRHPTSGLMQASDGNLYGATESGGPSETGVIYRLDLAGNYTMLATVADALIGSVPNTELIEGADGKLYGTTIYGNLYGTIYTIDLTQKIDSITPASGPAAGGTAVSIAGGGFVAGAVVNIGSATATGVSVPDSAHINATTPANTAGTIQSVKVTLPDTTVILLNNGWFSDFLDVPTGDIFHDFVRKMVGNGITAGCGGGNYCRNNPVTRAQMAVFLLKAEHGSSYTPPNCIGTFFDVPCPGTFSDWIEQLAAEGITGGCGGGNYCPGNPVTRAQMAVFLLKTEHGSGFIPPVCAGIFGDVACPSTFADWIEQLYAEAVTGGCSISPLLYCPGSSVLRGQMAAFLVKTFSLP